MNTVILGRALSVLGDGKDEAFGFELPQASTDGDHIPSVLSYGVDIIDILYLISNIIHAIDGFVKIKLKYLTGFSFCVKMKVIERNSA